MTAHPKPGKPKRVKPSGKSPTHLDQIRRLPCLLSGGPAEAAHIRFADAAYDKPETGAGRKPDDRWCVPLSPLLHRLNKGCQHDSNEREWWAQFGVDPLKVAELLWKHRDSRITMERVIVMNQPWDAAVKVRIAQIMRNEKGRK